MIGRRTLLEGALLAASPLAARAQAKAPTIRIGVLNDQSGPYRDAAGMGSIVCAQQALVDFGDQGFPVEMIYADHQNQPDLAVGIMRKWMDVDGVDLILDVPNSAIALALAPMAQDRNKVAIFSGAGTADLTGKQCTPNTIHWAYDTYMLARSTGTQIVKAGGDKWFFITADYAFGTQMVNDATKFIEASGGIVTGNARYPFPSTSDFSSYLLQAQASGANVIGFASAGSDTINGIKQAHEFGLNRTMKMAALSAHHAEIAAIGAEMAQGVYLTSSFYWDMDDRTRSFTRRVVDRMPQTNPPNMVQAACYAGALHYLKAVAVVGAARAKQDGRAVVAQMKATPTDDPAFKSSRIREDGRVLLPVYLFQAKQPADVHGHWDVLNTVATTPGSEAWRPLSEGGCPMIRS